MLSRNKDRSILFFTLLAEFCLLHLLSWPNVTFWGLRGTNFMDMAATLNFSECYKEYGLAIYGTVPQEFCSNYVYGTLLIGLLYLISSTTWISILLGLLSLVLISGVIAHFVSLINVQLPYKLLFGIFLVISPPIALLAERGNIDSIIIFVLLISLSLCYSKPDQFSGFLLLALTCAIKFYTLPLFVIIFFCQKRYSKVSQILLFAITIMLTMLDFFRIESLPTKSPYASFGNSLFGDYVSQIYAGTTLAIIVGMIFGFITYVSVLIFFRLILKRDYTDVTFSGSEKNIFLSFYMFLVFLSCYFAGRNYDYRLLILIISIYFLVPVCPRRIKATLLTASFVCLFLSYNVNSEMQAVGDVFLLVLLSFVSALFLANRRIIKEIVI